MNKLPWDAIERIVACLLVGSFVWRMGDAVIEGGAPWVTILICFGELLALFFFLFRRPTENVSKKSSEWALAFGATIAPTLIAPGGVSLIPIWLAAALFSLTIIAQLATKMSLNRSFGIVPANRGVMTDGFYAIVRHPVYASYLLGHLVFLLVNPTLWNFAVYAFSWTLQIVRIHAEERFLSQDQAYRDYQQIVRYRLVPGVY